MTTQQTESDDYQKERAGVSKTEDIADKTNIEIKQNHTKCSKYNKMIKKRNKIQKQAVTALIKASLHKPIHYRITCNMFCGTGKSHVMMKYLQECWKINHNDYQNILFLCPSLQILQQLKQIFLLYMTNKTTINDTKMHELHYYNAHNINESHHNNAHNINEQPIPHYKLLTICSKSAYINKNEINNDTENEINNDTEKDIKKIVLCTYQSCHILQNSTFDLAFYDEAHRSTSPKFSLTLSDEFTQIRQRIFFTATIKHYKSCTNEYKDMLNHELYGPTVFRYTYNNAVNDGVIVPFREYCFPLDYYHNDANWFPFDSDNILINNPITKEKCKYMMHLIHILIKHIQQQKQAKILTYHNTLNHAKLFQKLLKQCLRRIGFNNMYIVAMNGKMDIKERKNIFTRFINSPFSCICSNKVLNEGINLHCVDTILFAEPRKSEIDIIQCLGRGVRHYSSKNYEKRYCNIIAPMTENYEYIQHSIFNLLKILNNDTYNCSKYLVNNRFNCSKSSYLVNNGSTYSNNAYLVNNHYNNTNNSLKTIDFIPNDDKNKAKIIFYNAELFHKFVSNHKPYALKNNNYIMNHH